MSVRMHTLTAARRAMGWLWLAGLLFAVPLQADPAPGQALWSQLLQDHVVTLDAGATQVDYAGFARDREILKRYLASLSAVSPSQFEGWGRDDQLAFLINAYNAWTIELILTGYPDLESIRDLGSLFRSPWRKAFIPLLGETVSLDEIEHEMIRGSDRYREPRIHFAVNCASIGCPALREAPYVGEKLDHQLAHQTRRFLQDTSRNRLTTEGLALSAIFKWYRDDFERGWGGYKRLEDFLADYAGELTLSAQALRQLRAGELDIDFLDYDWALNSLPDPAIDATP